MGAVDLAITHNSLTINLDKLDIAHRRVGETYHELQPIRTTCGTIGSGKVRWRDLPIIRSNRRRLRWLRHLLPAVKVRWRIKAPVVLGDSRREIDRLSFSDDSPLHLFNMDRAGGFAEFASEPLRLSRRGQPVVMRTVRTLDDLIAVLAALPLTARVLIADIDLEDLEKIDRQPGEKRDWLVGSSLADCGSSVGQSRVSFLVSRCSVGRSN